MSFKQFITEAPAVDLLRKHYIPRILKLVADPSDIVRQMPLDRDIPVDSPRFPGLFAELLAYRLLGLDPTSNAIMARGETGSIMMGKYSRQILEWFIKTLQAGLPFSNVLHYMEDEDLDLRNMLYDYDQNLQYLPEEYRTITAFKSLEHFNAFYISDFKELTEEVKSRKLMSSIKVWWDEDDWWVITPLTYHASVHFGSPDWCTADPTSSNHFNRYTKKGTLIMILNRNDKTESLQVFFPGKPVDGELVPSGEFECKDWFDQDADYSANVPQDIQDHLYSEGFVDPSHFMANAYVSYDENTSEIVLVGSISDADYSGDIASVSGRFKLVPTSYRKVGINLVESAPEVYWAGTGMAFVGAPGSEVQGLDAFISMYRAMLSNNGMNPGSYDFEDLLSGSEYDAAVSGSSASFDWLVLDDLSFSMEDRLMPYILAAMGISYNRLETLSRSVGVSRLKLTLYYRADSGDLADSMQDPLFRKWFDNRGGEVDPSQLELDLVDHGSEASDDVEQYAPGRG